tara:strand:- start:575 stop:757 length:183 start_codon:yes stop_codon:yes gene_type:complete
MVSVGVSGYGKFILVMVEGWGIGATFGRGNVMWVGCRGTKWGDWFKIFYMANGGRITTHH